MKKSIIKMNFLTPIHVGNNSLTDNGYDLMADTIFSALCLECNDIKHLVQLVKDGHLKLSDAFPFIDDYFYIPKPMIYVEQKTGEYKLFNKIKYITHDLLDAFLNGDLYPEDEIANFILGDSSIRTKVRVGEDPYQLGVYSFKKNSGLYVIVEHEDDYIIKLFEKLQFSGIGGKRSSGLGRFSISIEDCFEFPSGNKKLLLNTAMAKNQELEKTLDGANYLLQKRSGFINQSNYKKQDFYTFKSGSIFDNEFAGNVYNVGNDENIVYRYAVPMFMGVNV